MVEQVVGLPQIEAFNRVLGLPIIELALAMSASTYSRVKDSNQLFHWVLSSAETSLTTATKHAVPMAVPIAKKFETSIQFFDNTLCLGLDKIEEKVPIVKETPNQILENAYMLALDTVRPAVSTIAYANELIIAQAANFKTSSWNKANQILSTHFGTAAVNGLDNTAALVDNLLDKYFPATETEKETAPTSSEEDKLLHTLQTVGRLSNKTARRLYSNVIVNLRTINKESLKTYVNSIVQFLQLTQYLHAVNQKVQSLTTPKKKDAEKSGST
ncbi:lipid storage droplets surface-binding protein 2-like [Venturia canescens]|uniref:lipid storage droplets surface-binding protein 2-like n=1 Tax=Venturia canescens TaxID=32260 RepID=UPI001C9C5E2B|nr:lipid storage droplets surface-binding protein 2-like [Venturia canescens]